MAGGYQGKQVTLSTAGMMVTRIACFSVFHKTQTWYRKPSCRCAVKTSLASDDSGEHTRPCHHCSSPEDRSKLVSQMKANQQPLYNTGHWKKFPFHHYPSAVFLVSPSELSPLSQGETSFNCRRKVAHGSPQFSL